MTLPAPYYQRGNTRIFLGDCLSILPHLSGVDAVVTDPPYGVNLGSHAASREKRSQFQRKRGYASYDDTPENFEAVVVPAIRLALTIAGRGLVFAAGTQMWSLPRGDAVGGVYLPAGNGRCSWGFQNLAHCVMYGACPDLNLGAKQIVLRSVAAAEASDHPCPKPTSWMEWAIGLASRPSETILDPFTGSGTTGVACINTGRAFIGIEIEERYCEIAARRLDEAWDSQALYNPVPKQSQLVLGGAT